MNSITLSEKLLPINANRNMGCYVEILVSAKGQLDALLSHHSRALVFTLIFHLNHNEEKNTLISKFMRKLKKKLKQRYGLKRIGHLWVREQKRSEYPHYHVAIMLDGNTVNRPFYLIALCEEIWEGWNQPKPYTPKNCYHLIARDDAEKYKAVFERLSYFAKTNTKGKRAKTVNDYSASRIANKCDVNS